MLSSPCTRACRWFLGRTTADCSLKATPFSVEPKSDAALHHSKVPILGFELARARCSGLLDTLFLTVDPNGNMCIVADTVLANGICKTSQALVATLHPKESLFT